MVEEKTLKGASAKKMVKHTVALTLLLSGYTLLRDYVRYAWRKVVEEKSLWAKPVLFIALFLGMFAVFAIPAMVALVSLDRLVYPWYEPHMVEVQQADGTTASVDYFADPSLRTASEQEKFARMLEAAIYDLRGQVHGPFFNTFAWVANDPWIFYPRDDLRNCQGGAMDGEYGGIQNSTHVLVESLLQNGLRLGTGDLVKGGAMRAAKALGNNSNKFGDYAGTAGTPGGFYRDSIRELERLVDDVRSGEVEVSFRKDDLKEVLKVIAGAKGSESSQKGVLDTAWALLNEDAEANFCTIGDFFHASVCALRPAKRVLGVIYQAYGNDPEMIPSQAMRSLEEALKGMDHMLSPESKPYVVTTLKSPWPGNHLAEVAGRVGLAQDRITDDIVSAIRGGNN